jgi:TatD DNase family protein
MKLIDTHTHIYLEQFDDDRKAVIQQAKAAGVEYCLLPNIDLESVAAMLATQQIDPSYLPIMIGLHPSSVEADYLNVLDKLEEELDRQKCIAVGEIGMDLYWDKTYKEEQEKAFRIQCQWAIDRDLPISLHNRDAYDNIIRILKEIKHPKLRGVFHCFGGNEQQAKEVIDLGFALGIGGVVTFKNSNLREDLANIDPKHIVLETDAPFLAPVPKRGKRNEPAYLELVIKTLANVFHKSEEEIAEITTQNAKRIFQLD